MVEVAPLQNLTSAAYDGYTIAPGESVNLNSYPKLSNSYPNDSNDGPTDVSRNSDGDRKQSAEIPLQQQRVLLYLLYSREVCSFEIKRNIAKSSILCILIYFHDSTYLRSSLSQHDRHANFLTLTSFPADTRLTATFMILSQLSLLRSLHCMQTLELIHPTFANGKEYHECTSVTT